MRKEKFTFFAGILIGMLSGIVGSFFVEGFSRTYGEILDWRIIVWVSFIGIVVIIVYFIYFMLSALKEEDEKRL